MHADQPEDKAILLRLRSRNHWMRNNFTEALNDTLSALKLLGVEVDPAPTKKDAAVMFEQVKNEILAVGFDEILSIPRTTEPRTELAVALLNDAGKPHTNPQTHMLSITSRDECILEPLAICLCGCHRTDGKPSMVQ